MLIFGFAPLISNYVPLCSALCMGSRMRVMLAAALFALIAGCGQGSDGDELVSQAERILSQCKPDCALEISFAGVGEGDADNAYATLRLKTGPASDRRARDVEVLVSRLESDRWEISQVGSEQLIEMAAELCDR